MEHKIILNFLQHATAISAVMPKQEVYSSGGLSWVDSGLKSDTFNIAFVRESARVKPTDLADLQSFYRQREAAFCLWIPEGQLSPELFRGLAQQGISRQAEALGMGLNMADYFAEKLDVPEIERVIMADPRVSDAVVVRQDDQQWGEVPVAFVSRHEDTLSEAEIFARCREQLAGYKQPKAIHFVAFDRFPRSTTGKIQRHEVESWL